MSVHCSAQPSATWHAAGDSSAIGSHDIADIGRTGSQYPDGRTLAVSTAGVLHVRRWVQIAVGLLGVSGVAPLILIAGRGSFLADNKLVKEMFHSAVVVHVDLSVLAWFFALLALFWALASSHESSRLPYVRGASQVSFVMGGALIGVAPLVGGGHPIMNNYVPVYTSPLFFVGLSLILAGSLLAMLAYCTTKPRSEEPLSIAVLGTRLTIPIALLCLICFGLAYYRIEAAGIPAGDQIYYEILFWAGGHVLQLAITQLLLVAWLWLAHSAGLRLTASSALLRVICWITPLVALTSILGFTGTAVPYDLYLFTLQMRYGGGLATLLLGLVLLPALLKLGQPMRQNRVAWSCLVVSSLVFAAGGFIGYMIGGSNTIIPAHYHGAIVGTTTAFMGVIYLLLPRIGAQSVTSSRWTLAQPWLYGGGSLAHVIGFAVAGGNGAARKTVDVATGQTAGIEAGLYLVRLGGLLAVVGGALFVVIVVRAFRAQPLRS